MTTKTKAHPLNGIPHTAGIFSDMSIDGPEIGTLVVIVDRAKNLPNRKTIGKQDPYCAARLGKEAKKTNTDIRGGQTPKWDQELRFTVHDSPDYYQLKVSVFNDDKKTELIGETWIDLRDIIVSGGGQSDQWHQLAYRGKYAGEVRIEITYYDTRPKPEKPAVKAKPPAPVEAEATPAPSGPRTVPKRRPLPSDPVTGQSPAAPAPDLVEMPPRPQPNPVPIQHQPQQAEYTQGPPAPPQSYYQQPEHPRQESARDYGTPSRAPPQQYQTPDRPEQYAVQHRDQGCSPQHQQPAYDHHDPYDFPQQNGVRGPEDDRPPPPPAHRSRTGSNTSMNGGVQGTMRHDVLRNEAHRNSTVASYPGRPTYKAYDSAPAGLAGPQYSQAEQAPPPRHYSYDPAYDQHRTMQATVEDVPESPESMNNAARRTSGRWPLQPQPQSQFEPGYEMVASPAPLNVERNSNEEMRYQPQDQPGHQGPNGYHVGSSEIPMRESAQYGTTFGRHSESSLHSSYETQRALTYRGEPEDTSAAYSVPSVPPSLVPGIDPGLAQEISERISQDRRQTIQTRRYAPQALVETPPRGRTMDHRYDHDGSPAYNAAPPAHSRSPMTYTNGPSTSTVNVLIKSRAYSPNPPRDPSPLPHHQQTIRRKSVSPRPPVESRRLSEIPFGPDSYDALNPTAASAAVKDGASSQPNYREETGKIITHDGREVDPSDHLPVESWAPEPEPKAPTTSPAARPSPSGPQPAPTSGRRPLRIAARPQSMLPSTAAITFSGGPDHVEAKKPSPPASTGRNRLQKKAAYRQSTSAIPAVPVMSGANGPGPTPTTNTAGFRKLSGGSSRNVSVDPAPLQHIPPHQDNFTAPRGLPRASTFDSAYSNGATGSENHPPHQSRISGNIYGTSPGHHNNHNNHHSQNYNNHSYGHPPNRTNTVANGPPIPAKLPLALPAPSSSSTAPSQNMSGALQLHSSSVARRMGSGIDDVYQQDAYGSGGHHGRGGGGGGYGREVSALEEEMRAIDIGVGRSSRRGATGTIHGGHGGAGGAYGSQGYARRGGNGYHGGGGQHGYAYGQGGY